MDFNSIAFSPFSRMNEVKRYSSVYQETEETLAEHITEVSSMSYLIAKYMIKNGESIDLGVLLEKCLIHDVDEVITGDIPRNTKYASAESKEQIDKIASSAIDLIESMTDIDIFDLWTNAKLGKEGLILKVVDMLVVVKKAITEIELRGNLTFLKVIIELESHLNRMYDNLNAVSFVRTLYECPKSYEILEKLVKEAKDEIVTIRVKYEYVIKKYRFRENVIKGE